MHVKAVATSVDAIYYLLAIVEDFDQGYIIPFLISFASYLHITLP